jgi:exodeoxyribonuclease VIII
MEVGIYTRDHLSNEQYHQSEGISKSGLDLIDRSPAHFKSFKRENTRAKEVGSAIHCAILEPEIYQAEYAVIDCEDRRSAIYKAACKDRASSNVLTQAEGDRVSGMFDAVYSYKPARAIMDAPGRNELSVYAKDPETGLLVKCRFDRLLDCGIAADLKKTQDARPEAFMRSIDNYRYYVQAAFYMDVYKWATGETLQAFKFIPIEEAAPHGCRVYQIDDLSIEFGRMAYRAALNTYADCIANDSWPAYADEEQEIGISNYLANKLQGDSLDLSDLEEV